MSELWDLYDVERTPLHKTVERDKQEGCEAYHIIVFIAVKNKDGRYLITRRAPEKSAPGMWEFTGGSAIAGEDSERAALRECFEETGIDHKDSERYFLGTLTKVWQDSKSWHGGFCDFWLFKADFKESDIKLLDGETDAYRLVTREELTALKNENFFIGDRLDTLFSREEELK